MSILRLVFIILIIVLIVICIKAKKNASANKNVASNSPAEDLDGMDFDTVDDDVEIESLSATTPTASQSYGMGLSLGGNRSLGTNAGKPNVNNAPTPKAQAAKPRNTKKNVAIKFVGRKKLDAIKQVRIITGYSLKEAKDIVESCGTIRDLSPENAEKLVSALARVGSFAEIEE